MEIVKDTVVIGAGLTGLTTAYYLKKSANDFVVLEKENRVGGVINTVSEKGFIYEEGPNSGVIGNTDVVELFDELAGKCELEIAGGNVNKRYICKNGKWEPIPMGLVGAIKTPLYTLKDKFRLLGEPFRARGKDPHENLSTLVRRRLGESFLKYTVDPFIIGVYAGDPDYLIPKYALPKLYNLEQKYGSFIGGSVKKGFEKKTPLEKRVKREVFSCKNGLGSLTNALNSSIGQDNIILNVQDIKVEPAENGFTVTFKTKDHSGLSTVDSGLSVISAKHVITTVGAFALDKILPFVESRAMSKINSLIYTKVFEIALGWDKWEGRPLDGFGGLIPFVEKRDLLGVLFMSAIFEGRSPVNGALLSLFMGGVRRQDLMSLNEDEVSRIIEKETMQLMLLKNFNPSLFKIMRHNWAIPQYGLDSGERFETVKMLEAKYKGLIIGGNLRNGIGMADRIQQGRSLAKEITN